MILFFYYFILFYFIFILFFFIFILFLGNERVFVWEANCRSDNCKKVHYAPLFLLPQFCSFLTLAKKERKILIKKKNPKSVHFSVKLMCSSFSDFCHFTWWDFYFNVGRTGTWCFFFLFFIRITIFGKWNLLQCQANFRSNKCKKKNHYGPLFLFPQF